MKFIAHTTVGSGRGKELGFPTINVDLSDVPKGIEEGIYAGKVKIDEKEFQAAIHFGPRLFHKEPDAFEVHLIDTPLDSLPTEIEIELVKRLRGVCDFDNEEQLKSQISVDIGEARDILDAL